MYSRSRTDKSVGYPGLLLPLICRNRYSPKLVGFMKNGDPWSTLMRRRYALYPARDFGRLLFSLVGSYGGDSTCVLGFASRSLFAARTSRRGI